MGKQNKVTAAARVAAIEAGTVQPVSLWELAAGFNALERAKDLSPFASLVLPPRVHVLTISDGAGLVPAASKRGRFGRGSLPVGISGTFKRGEFKSSGAAMVTKSELPTFSADGFSEIERLWFRNVTTGQGESGRKLTTERAAMREALRAESMRASHAFADAVREAIKRAEYVHEYGDGTPDGWPGVKAIKRMLKASGRAKVKAEERKRRAAESKAVGERNEARPVGVIGSALAALSSASPIERLTCALAIGATKAAVQTVTLGKCVVAGEVVEHGTREALGLSVEDKDAGAVLVSTLGCEWIGGATKGGGVAVVSDASRDEAFLSACAAVIEECRAGGWRAARWFKLVPAFGPLTQAQAALCDDLGQVMAVRVPGRHPRASFELVFPGSAEVVSVRLPVGEDGKPIAAPRVHTFLRHLRAARRAAQRAVSSLNAGLRGRKSAGAVAGVTSLGSPDDWGKLTAALPVSPASVPDASALVTWHPACIAAAREERACGEWREGNEHARREAFKRAVAGSGLLAMRRARAELARAGKSTVNVNRAANALWERLKLAAGLLGGRLPGITGNASAAKRAKLKDAVSLLLPPSESKERAALVGELASAFYFRC